jgi:multisubunit Na+/H+ antiporter MnhB subunit
MASIAFSLLATAMIILSLALAQMNSRRPRAELAKYDQLQTRSVVAKMLFAAGLIALSVAILVWVRA